MKTLWRFMETFHLLFAQLRDGFSILLRERWRWTTCWEAMDVCDRKFCGESRRINSRRPYYNTQILSLGAWCKLRKSAHAIVHEQLGWSKRCARWIPHQLTTEQKEQRVTIRRNWLQLFEPEGPKRFSDVVTGDECWISFFTMKDKHSNMVWVAEDEPRPEVLKTGFRSRKRMFTNLFNTQGPVVVDMMPDKATTTAAYYTSQFYQISSTYSVHGTNPVTSRQR